MKIDIYTSAINGSKYLSVPAGVDPATLALVEPFDDELRSLSPFRTRLELDPSKPRAILDQIAVFNQIEARGYAVHGTTGAITLGQAAGPAASVADLEV